MGQVPGPLISCSLAFAKSFIISGPQFLHPYMEIIIPIRVFDRQGTWQNVDSVDASINGNIMIL